MQTACGPRGRCTRSTLPPKHLPKAGCWAQLRGGGCTEHAGSQSCRAVQPDVGEAPALQVKLLPRHGGDTCAHPHAHACRGGTRRAQAQILRPGCSQEPGSVRPSVCASLLGHPKSRSSAAAGLPRALQTGEPHGHGPGSQPAALGAKPHIWGTELPSCPWAPLCPPAASGACWRAGLWQDSAPVPHACFARCPGARIKPGPGAGAPG